MNFMKKLGTTVLTLVMLLCGANASAALVRYDIVGNGSGTIGDYQFVDQDFDISFVGDVTGNVAEIDPLLYAQISVSGLPSTTLQVSTRIGVNQTNQVAYFGLSGALDYFDFYLDTPVTNLNTVFSVTGHSVFALGQFLNIASTLGPVSFSSSSDVVFFSTPVPEPATYAMLVAGLVLLGVAARRRNTRG